MSSEPRLRDDYRARQVEAAHRVLVDLGQVLAAFEDCLVVVGGWVPDLLLKQADEPHIGSIEVDLALDGKEITEYHGKYQCPPSRWIQSGMAAIPAAAR